MRRHRERQADVHPGRIALHRRIEKLLHLGKRDDLVKLCLNFLALHSQNRTVEKNVFPSGQFGMKSCTHFQQARDPALQCNPPFRGFGNPAQHLEQGRLSCAVSADNADAISFVDFK